MFKKPGSGCNMELYSYERRLKNEKKKERNIYVYVLVRFYLVKKFRFGLSSS